MSLKFFLYWLQLTQCHTELVPFGRCDKPVPIQVQQQNSKRIHSWKNFEANNNDKSISNLTFIGDKRRHGHGFGHVSAATPICINDHSYFSTMLGTCYVINAKAETFDQNTLVAVNDLGLPNQRSHQGENPSTLPPGK